MKLILICGNTESWSKMDADSFRALRQRTPASLEVRAASRTSNSPSMTTFTTPVAS